MMNRLLNSAICILKD